MSARRFAMGVILESMHFTCNSAAVGFVSMSVPWFATESVHFYMQMNNCRVCKHACDKVCNVDCMRSHAVLFVSEQPYGL